VLVADNQLVTYIRPKEHNLVPIGKPIVCGIHNYITYIIYYKKL